MTSVGVGSPHPIGVDPRDPPIVDEDHRHLRRRRPEEPDGAAHDAREPRPAHAHAPLPVRHLHDDAPGARGHGGGGGRMGAH